MTSLPLWTNVVGLVVAGAATWRAGARVARAVDELAAARGTGQSFLGALLLGGITSLPEAATVTTAAAVGGASFAVGNVLGSASANLALLAAADIAVFAKPIVQHVDRDALQQQAGLLVVLLALTTCAVAAGEPFQLRVGGWTLAIVAAAVVCLVLLQRQEHASEPDERVPAPDGRALGGRWHATHLVAPAALVLAAGYAAARAGTALAEQSGLSGGFVGFALLAVSTSLPELSTTTTALRLGRPTLAFSGVLGTNIFNHLLFLPADLAGAGPPLFAALETSVLAAAGLALVVVGVYVAALAGRPKATGRRAGGESLLVLAAYGAGVALLFAVG